ncbi:MAG: DNA polymerase III subunit alpha, partial [Nitrospirae bacterium]
MYIMKQSGFVPLHLHTEYSLLDGAIRIKELMQKAVEFGMPAVAITDHGNLFGAIEFYRAALDAGIKPIIGCEVYIAPEGRRHRAQNPDGVNAFHLILLARNLTGYRNLSRLVTAGFLEGFYYKPRIDLELLEKHSEGLTALSSCLHGEVPFYLTRGDKKKAEEAAKRYLHIFGEGNFFLELQHNGIPEQYKTNKKLVELSRKTGIPVVATNDCHYLNKEDVRAHDVLLCIQTNKTINSPDRMKFNTDQLYFKSPEEMESAFSDLPEAIENTLRIAESCNLAFNLGKTMLPRFEIEGGKSPEEVLEQLAYDGLGRKFPDGIPEKYTKRLEYELSVIKSMGFAPYFLIVWDFINYAKKKGIPVGPGRGSAAGSLVAYSLEITEIDPIKYDLLFERFLNPERVSMPDIDVDFCKDRRDEVIQYVSQKYGKDHVAQIITFGAMKARAVIRDVGRALGIPYNEVDKIAKLVPEGPGVTLKEALEKEKELRDKYEQNEEIKELIDLSMRLEGLARHASTHAAGVVISPSPLLDYTPLHKNPSEDTITTQFDMKNVEKIGLLKFDFLGLKTLTVIHKTVEYLRERGVQIELKDIPLDDADTYKMLSAGDTTGVFQLESGGMRELLVKLQPNRFEDLIALVALYRPGPLGSGMDVDFIKRKKGEEKITYEVPELEGILGETYGTILYQEQVMRIANELGGFTMGQADQLRKAMGKKIMDQMTRMREEFIKGATQRGIPVHKAEKIYNMMEYFAKYGFNKSHSAAYAYLSYQTAYLKAHYPVEFMAANLSNEEQTDKIVKFINECRAHNIPILPPDINLSQPEFTVVEGAIRFGLDAVKGVGHAAVEEIISKRKEAPYSDLDDLLQRIDTRKVNRKVLESLIKAGVLDSLGERSLPQDDPRSKDIHYIRAYCMKKITDLLDRRLSPSLFGQQSLLAPPDPFENLEPWSEDEVLSNEKESLGFYITGHPIEKFKHYLRLSGVKEIADLQELPDRESLMVAGIITDMKRTYTKGKGEAMATFLLEDDTGILECIAFPDVYRNNSHIIIKNNLLVLYGDLDRNEKGIKFLLREVYQVEDIFNAWKMRFEIIIKEEQLKAEKLKEIRRAIEEHKGDSPVYIRLRKNGEETLFLMEDGLTPNFGIIDLITN